MAAEPASTQYRAGRFRAGRRSARRTVVAPSRGCATIRWNVTRPGGLFQLSPKASAGTGLPGAIIDLACSSARLLMSSPA